MRDLIYYLGVFAILYAAWAHAASISPEDAWRYQCQIGCRRASYNDGTSAGREMCGCIDYIPRGTLIEQKLTFPRMAPSR